MAFAKAGRYQENLLDSSGTPLASTAVTVRLPGTATAATLYTSAAKTASASNPVNSDSFGNLAFFADPGLYDLLILGVTVPNVHVALDGPNVNDKLTGLVFDVVADFGAVSGGSSAVNKAAFLAAINAAKAATKGGLVYVPPGTFDVGDLAITVPNSATQSVNIAGAGMNASRIHFTTDRGADTFAIAGVSAGGTCFNKISDLQIQGPGSGLTYGTSPANMHGIKLHGGMVLERVEVGGFKAGLVSSSDHVTVRRVNSKNNFYGLYFAYQTTQADHLFDNCDLTSNAKASVAIATGAANLMGGTTFLRGHLGYGPYGVYIETGSTATKMNNVQFLGTSFEALGNAAIYSEGQSADAFNITFDGCEPFSINNAVYGLPSSTAPYMFHLNAAGQWRIQNTNMVGFGSLPTTAFFNIISLYLPLVWEDSWWNALESAIAGGTSMFIVAANYGGVSLRSGGGGGLESKVHQAIGNTGGVGVVQKGDLVSRSNGGGVVRNTGNTIPCGVALNTPTRTNELCIVATDAEYVYVNTVETSVTSDDVLVPDATTDYKVAKVALGSLTAAQSACIIGKPRDTVASVSGGKFLAAIRI